jgi:DNA-binding response OmpR family regulator
MDVQDAVTVDLRRRVLVVAAGAMRQALTEQLRAEGFDVSETEDALAVVELARQWRPDLVVVEEVLPQRSGRQVVLSLRASGDLFKVAVAGVLTDLSVGNVLKWLRVGATDIWRFPFTRDVPSRTRALIDECDRSQVQLGRMRPRMLAWAGRAMLTGTVTTYPGTPFEGRASFIKGELQEARFGDESGDRALDQLLELEDGPVLWEETPATMPEKKAVRPAGYKARVLLVEDDPTLRTMVMRQLAPSGYVVEYAVDGQAGLQLARQKPWDIVVADLDLPRLDGWGLLRALRSDVALREISVMVLSAHDTTVDTLKAARAGARAYLKKSGRSKELLDALGLLANPRARVWDALAARTEAKVELRSVGSFWLLRAIAELDCMGRLELEDELGRYELSVAQGHLVDVVAQLGSLRMNGRTALEALISSRGEGRFVFEKLELPKGSKWLYEVIDASFETMRKEEARKVTDAAANPGRLYLNEELAGLFARVATVGELKVLDGVRTSPDSLDSLAKSTGLPVTEVEPALAELVRRGVLTTEA